MTYLKSYDENQAIVERKRKKLKTIFLSRLDRKWQRLGHCSRKALYFARVLSFFSKRLEDETVQLIEIGSGNGDFLRYKHPNLSKTVLEIDDFYRDYFEGEKITFLHQDASVEKVHSIENGTIDIIALNHVIEHIKSIDFGAVPDN